VQYSRELVQQFNEERAVYLSFMGITEKDLHRYGKKDYYFHAQNWYGHSVRIWIPNRLCTPKEYNNESKSKILTSTS